MNEMMSEMIQKMDNFDEQLKLKLHLNMELAEQDLKMWEKHEYMLQSIGNYDPEKFQENKKF